MDSKEQIIVTLKKENELLKRENEFLKTELIKFTGGIPDINQQNQVLNYAQLPFIKPNNPVHQTTTNEDIEKIKEENNELKKIKEKFQRQNTNLENENMILSAKLNNLENVFVGSQIIRNSDGSITNESGQDYNLSTVRILLFYSYLMSILLNIYSCNIYFS